jgi:hypothetical protein
MIADVDDAILDFLREGLSELVPTDDIIIGEVDTSKPISISLLNTHFTVEEQGIGGSGSVKKEEIVETFDSDGKETDFTLSKKPLQPLVIVENPVGTEKKEPDDYFVDYSTDSISFRESPEKGTVQVKYCIARAVAETRNLKFILNYSLAVWANDPVNRDSIALEAIKVLYRERPGLEKRHVSEIRMTKGYLDYSDKTMVKRVLEYQVETTITIELPLPPMAQIEIGRIGE